MSSRITWEEQEDYRVRSHNKKEERRQKRIAPHTLQCLDASRTTIKA